jgi:HAMP domain-containing protein
MSLRKKFNLVMAIAFLVGLVLAGVLMNVLSERSARRAVLSEAAIMMGQANATIHYTDTQVSPLLSRSMKVQFIPQAIPFFAAQRTFDNLSKNFPDYTFRQPARNPTNPADRPAPWENDIIQTLGAQPKLQSLVTERQTAAGRILSYSQPVRVSSSDCLSCHSTPQAAPPSMIDAYGSENGFGWKLGDLVGAQIVSVPERVALMRARHSLYAVMGGLFAVFAVMMVLINLLLHRYIITPIGRISRVADEVSLGNMDAPEFELTGRDEIATLSVSFNRMRRSLAAAFRMLED